MVLGHFMTSTKNESFLSNILLQADIQIGGERLWDIQIKDQRAVNEIIHRRSLGLGESYMRGWWDCDDLEEMFYKLLSANIYKLKPTFREWVRLAISKAINFQSLKKADEVCKQHYDIDIDLYERMLDPKLIYTCAYWENASDLLEAQENKLRMICEKLELRAGEVFLDIGCGFGGLLKFAVENYGVRCIVILAL